MTEFFEYNGYHFSPIGRVSSRQKMSKTVKYLYSNKQEEPHMTTYGNGNLPYTYDDFYKASGDSEADVFICRENGKVYIPGENELFEYRGKYY